MVHQPAAPAQSAGWTFVCGAAPNEARYRALQDPTLFNFDPAGVAVCHRERHSAMSCGLRWPPPPSRPSAAATPIPQYLLKSIAPSVVKIDHCQERPLHSEILVAVNGSKQTIHDAVCSKDGAERMRCAFIKDSEENE
jgi:hypothetical protein